MSDKPRHGGHLVAEVLASEGIPNLFTLSGGHIAPIYDGCVDAGLRIVDFRHEQSAAHAADGWARVTLQTGVAAVTAGPGVTDAVTGIANAMYANSPVLVLSGKNPIVEFGMGSLQEMDQVALVSSGAAFSAPNRKSSPFLSPRGDFNAASVRFLAGAREPSCACAGRATAAARASARESCRGSLGAISKV